MAVPHPSVKRNEYWKEWPMCNRAITVSSFLFFRGQDIHSFNTGNILYNLFSGNSPHSDCHSSDIYLFVRGFRSEGGKREIILYGIPIATLCHHWPESFLQRRRAAMRTILMSVWVGEVIGKVTRQCPQTKPFWRERRVEAVSNRSPSAYQHNALPLGQTGSHVMYQSYEIYVYPMSYRGPHCQTPSTGLRHQGAGEKKAKLDEYKNYRYIFVFIIFGESYS